MTFVVSILVSAAALLGLPVALLFVEIVAAFRTTTEPEMSSKGEGRTKRVAVVVPAHNESLNIVPTLEDIRSQLVELDRLVVVADNCIDDTASVAAAHGAEVFVRDDSCRKGKGFALGFAIECLASNPPDFVIFVDADCRVAGDLIEKLTSACSQAMRPLQACYLMSQAESSAVDHGLAQFVWNIKNLVRPLGLRNMGLPVQLMGTGMIFPWHIIRSVPLSSDNLVEDMKLGLDLAEVGHAARFYPSLQITSEFPTLAKGTDSQRQRWVQGHLRMMRSMPRLLLKAIASRNTDLFALALDVLIPPLSLLVLLILIVFAAGLIGTVLAKLSAIPVVIATSDLVLLAAAIMLAWFGFGRKVLPFRKLLMIAPQLVTRGRLFARILRKNGRVVEWMRTDRRTSDREMG